MIERHIWKSNPSKYFHENEIVFYCASIRICRKYLKAFEAMGIKVAAICSNYLKGTFCGIRLINMEQLKHIYADRLIVIATSDYRKYAVIEELLYRYGLHNRLIEMNADLLLCLQSSFLIADIDKKYRFNIDSLIEVVTNLENENPNALLISECKRFSYGTQNPDKTFYIIRWEYEKIGIFSLWFIFMAHISYAINQGYIPIIDLKNYYCALLQNSEKMYRLNAWDYYFKQPYPEYSLEEVYQSKNVMLGYQGACPFPTKLSANLEMIKRKQDLAIWHSYMSKYSNFNENILAEVANIKEKIFGNKKIMGVSLRVVFTALKVQKNVIVNNHPEQLSIDELMILINRYMKKWAIDAFFLAIDERGAFNKINEKFKKEHLYHKRPLIHKFKNGILQMEPADVYHEFGGKYPPEDMARDYIIETILLSQCDCLLASKSSASVIAYIMNNGQYRHAKIIDKGKIKVK
jgi:hypothetical protein